ncbi:MAG: 4a-hydroxytetrahydrobiopterin dehydratase [Actinomycetales bacterium]|nr:4a-hydroxytetrahydrobiopterin dehydratase [Actinomycetales bacterium]
MATALTEAELASVRTALPMWQVDAQALTRSVRAPSFLAGIDWVVAIAAAAEELNHHPDIDIRWRTLRLALSTHDVGGVVSDLDVALAARIDAIVAGSET